MAGNVVGVIVLLAGAAWACGFDAAAAASSPAPVAASPAPAPASGELDLGPALAPIREKHHVPALAAALVEGDKVTAIGAVGVRSRSRAEPVTTEDLFHLGSCTKAMTATLIGAMVEEGTLRWDTTIAEGLPELASTMDEGYRKVTLTQLLTHRAGVPSDLSAGGLWAKLRKQEGTPVEQRDALARGVLSRPPVHAPGGEFLYSNAGFAIAGHIAEVRAGKAWEELLREKVFGPLGITTAGFGAPGTRGTAEKPDQPRGHGADGTPVEPGKNADNPPAIGPGGTVHMSLRDWAKFISLHVRGARGEEGLLLKAETFSVLHTPPAGTKEGAGHDYAMGWGTPEREWAGGTVLTHSGSNTLWFCVVWAAPKKNFAVLAATNTGEAAASAACDEAVQAAMKARR
jgi:CubicO group peptidase (beta-lactamase class C family)